MIRILIGTEEKTRIADRVLVHSIRSRASEPVDFTCMIGPAWEYSTEGFSQGTGFSLRRWLIPAACGWDGHAIYLDADQVVFGDIAELYHLGRKAMIENGSVAAMTYQPDKFSKKPWPQSSVMVIDCLGAKKFPAFHKEQMLAWLKAHPTKADYADFMHAKWMTPQPAILPNEWNALNTYTKGKTKLVHFTKEDSQVWYKPDHPLAGLWKEELVKAIKAGVVDKGEFEHALSQWGKKEDWRESNGIHPVYKKYLPLFAEAKK